MSSFWGVEVKPGKPYTLTDSDSIGRLRLTQATMGEAVGKGEKGAGGKKCVLRCSVENKDPVYLCALVPEQSETCHLELEFDAEVTFSVIGSRSIHLAGYFLPDDYVDGMSDGDDGSDSLEGSDDDGLLESDDDGNMVMLDHMETDSEDDGSDYDSESDDEDMVYNQRRGKSSVVIEEIHEDDKSAVSEVEKGSNKNSQLQLAVRTPPAESMESEDEDGFPVSLSESKKSDDRKRKSVSSGEVKTENDGSSKKKKKAKGKSTDVDSGKDEEKDVKPQDTPADTVDAKQKKKKNKNTSSSEVAADQQSAKKNQIPKDAKEATAQEASKKKSKKQKMQEANKSESQSQTGSTDSGRKEPRQTRTFANGMIIEELEMGKPDGKRATRGKKVAVKYIGKLKNGKIFDSNVGARPFEFRLGVGEVIKGWDVGVDGMRIGDKRRLTIPPSMGYGSKKVGPIPQNSTLYFDVELVNVK